MKYSASWKVFLAVSIAFSSPTLAQKKRTATPYTSENVNKAIDKGVEYLWSKQHDDGSWGDFYRPKNEQGESNPGYYVTGLTALACYALLDCGVDPNEPRMKKALDWMVQVQDKAVELKSAEEIKKMSNADKDALKKKESDMIETNDWRTYSIGLRCCVWFAANKFTQNKYKKNLEKDVNWLVNGTTHGGYSYIVPSRNVLLIDSNSPTGDNGDNSNGQYGQLGVWAGLRAGMEIPREYWYNSFLFWMNRQNKDGGWNYFGDTEESYGNMSAAGVATLFVCFDALFSESFSKCNVNHDAEMRALQKGLDWFDKNFERTLVSPGGFMNFESSFCYYYLYGVERVGLASGYKFFGKVDWYKEGTKKILNEQTDDGSWFQQWTADMEDPETKSRVMQTSLALLFLSRGQHPIIFNKLEYKGDWNNRPRDCANLCRWMMKALDGEEANWQIVTLKSDPAEWRDAPILYIGGSIAPNFTDADIAKLRTYVYQGGTIFSMAQCRGSAFTTGMKEVYKKLFPKYELQTLGTEHEFYKIHGLAGGKVKFSMVHNGIRPLALHTDEDLSLPWQQYSIATGKLAFDAAMTLFLYSTDKQVKKRGGSVWPPDVKEPFDTTIKVVRLKYAGNYDAEPLAMERFGRLMGAQYKTKIESPDPIDISALKDSGAKLAILTGTNAFKLNNDEITALKDYVEKGGLLLFDSGGGVKPFGDSAKDLIVQIWGPDSLLPLPLSNPVYQIKDMTIEKVKYRRVTKARTGGAKEPRLMAVLAGDRPKVFFTQEDIVAGLVGFPSYGCDGYEPESAFNVMRNMVLYSAIAPSLSATAAPAAESKPATK